MDLRAHLLADAAAQHNHLGYHQDALELVRLVEGDERLTPALRMVLHGVKARACAGLGDSAGCHRQVALAERAYAAARDADLGDGWVARVATPGGLSAVTGQAFADLARTNGAEANGARTNGADTDRYHAVRRLTQAVDVLDPGTHARTRTLCQFRLAGLHLAGGDLDHGVHQARQALGAASLIGSARLRRALAGVRKLAAEHKDVPVARELVADIDTATGTATGTAAATAHGAGSGEEPAP